MLRANVKCISAPRHEPWNCQSHEFEEPDLPFSPNLNWCWKVKLYVLESLIKNNSSKSMLFLCVIVYISSIPKHNSRVFLCLQFKANKNLMSRIYF